MKLNYHADTESLYIKLCDRPSVDSREISEGVVLPSCQQRLAIRNDQ